MKFRIRVNYVSGNPEQAWWEEHEDNDLESLEDVQSWAQKQVEFFNDTLRPGEIERVCERVEVLDANARRDHDWVKTSLAMKTIQDHIRDTYSCTSCGITGTRMGVRDLVRDKQYEARVYLRCDTSKKQLLRNASRKPGESLSARERKARAWKRSRRFARDDAKGADNGTL